MTAIVLDTDIGSDVDDILALAVILGSPELDLRGVTTVYGDTELRARLTLHALGLAGRTVPVAAGLAETRSGKPVWWAGHEGRLVPAADSIQVDRALDAVDLLAAAPTVVAIGPLTDLAAALSRPDHAVEHAVVMGADFRSDADRIAEHNIVSDVAAAQVVFASGVPVTVVGLDQTTRVRVQGSVVDALAATGSFGTFLAAEIRQFWGYTGEESNVPHDPIAVLMLTDPALFDFTTGTVTIDDTGLSTLRPDAAGPHRVASDLDEDAVSAAIVSRILLACETAS